MSIIHHGLTLLPLTAEVISRLPDLDPWQRDNTAIEHHAWAVQNGRHTHPLRLIRKLCQPTDALYYWDGPWGALAGSRGIAIVRDGRVIDAFTTLMA